jgi:hypothetical protein
MRMVSLAVAVAIGGCGKSPVGPSNNASPGTRPPIRLTIGGHTALAAIGETTQLTVTATFTDGTSRDVSSDVNWSSQHPGIASVSSSGMVRATALGAASISVRLVTSDTPTATARVTITPPGTFVVSGRVREPGSGPLQDVRVSESTSGASTLSQRNGEYALGGLTNTALTFEREAFEPVALTTTPNAEDDVPMQRVIRIAAGETASTTLAPHDMNYEVAPGTSCYPCRLIRVVVPEAGTLEARLRWTLGGASLRLWVAGRRFEPPDFSIAEIVTEVPAAGGEHLIYVGATSSVDYVGFSLATSYR